MPLNLTDKDPAIAMPEPASDRLEIDSRHDALRGEKMAQIMKPEIRQARAGAHFPQRFAKGPGGDILVAAPRRGKKVGGIGRSVLPHFGEKLLKFRVKVKQSGLAVLNEIGQRSDRHELSGEVDVGPAN